MSNKTPEQDAYKSAWAVFSANLRAEIATKIAEIDLENGRLRFECEQLRAEAAEKRVRELCDAGNLKCNVILRPGVPVTFRGEWVAVPRQDFDRLRLVLRSTETPDAK